MRPAGRGAAAYAQSVRPQHNMITTLRTLFLAVAITGCHAQAPHSRFASPWLRYVSADSMAAAYDPQRIAVRGDTVDVWLRFQYAKAQPVPHDSTATFTAIEAYESVNCPGGHVRDLRMLVRGATADSVGGYTDPKPAWQSFREHPLTERIFVPLCTVLDRK